MDAEQIVALVVGLAWPLTLLIVLVIFRDPLDHFLRDLSSRVTKIDLKVVALDLKTPRPANWQVDVIGTSVDVRALTTEQPFDSFISELLSQLERLDRTDVLVMDLGEGRSWLSSRMYLFTSLLTETRGVRCIVFTQTKGETNGHVMGWATPDDVRDAIAEFDPWLPAAYLSAESAVRGAQAGAGSIYTANGDTISIPSPPPPPEDAVQIARTYIRLIQRSMSPTSGDQGWLFVRPASGPIPPGSGLWERAQWLDPHRLPGALRATIDRQSIVTTDGSEESSTLKRSILLLHGPFVILARPDGTLKGVVERPSMLDQAVRSVLINEPA